MSCVNKPSRTACHYPNFATCAIRNSRSANRPTPYVECKSKAFARSRRSRDRRPYGAGWAGATPKLRFCTPHRISNGTGGNFCTGARQRPPRSGRMTLAVGFRPRGRRQNHVPSRPRRLQRGGARIQPSRTRRGGPSPGCPWAKAHGYRHSAATRPPDARGARLAQKFE